jgi:hypothetical protein
LTGFFCITNSVAAQQVKLSVVSPAEVRIRIDSIGAGREWSFRNAYAGVLGIAERVEQFHAFGVSGEDVGARKIATGEFRSNGVAKDIEYVVKLPPPDPASVSHVSWISGESGLLMLADLLPVSLATAATKVLEKYIALTNSAPVGGPLVMIAPLPVATGSVKWRAETRGLTVVLLMNPAAEINNWTGQLGIIFTHELLHLWVPNSLRLQGDYDWFFEGFTLYTALVTALELKFISANEFVATLRRVYDSYLSRPDELSLIDASERRWTTGNSTVYDKGMLVALLYDLAIRRSSGGKMWLGNLYKELFARWATQPADGNEVIIRLLGSTPAGADLAKSYIEGQRELDLKSLLADQKQLLKSLYYR